MRIDVSKLHPPADQCGIWGNYPWARLVKVTVVNACMPLPIGFRDEDDIGQPFWIIHFSHESYFQEFVHLFLYDLLPIRDKTMFLLPDWTMLWVHIELMHHYLWIYARHI